MTLNDQPHYPRPRARRALALPGVDSVVVLGLLGVAAVVVGVATFSLAAAVIVFGLFALAAAVLLARVTEDVS